MAAPWSSAMLTFLPVLLMVSSLIAGVHGRRQPYVVYMGASNVEPSLVDTLTTSHQSLLASAMVGDSEEGTTTLLYSYKHMFNGFAASMTATEAAVLAESPQVLSVFPSRLRKLHTTRSWEFLGLVNESGKVPNHSLWKKAKFGKNVVIGLFDSGIWPESASFNDDGVGPIPAKWKGECVTAQRFGPENCNRKLIGAKYYLKGFEAHVGPVNSTADFRSPRDIDGHGTHTSSTSAGNFVEGANTLGQARGTASGGAPHAHIAAYKVCWSGGGCDDSDILAAMDEAVFDGVDVFSASLGSDPPLYPFYSDSIAIASFHAVSKGIVSVCSAGNAGPTPGSVTNVAPWIVTVGASSIDRDFPSEALTEDGEVFNGQSSTDQKLPDEYFPLVSGADVGVPGSSASALCLNNTLDPSKVTGKIVTCVRGVNGRVEKGGIVKEAGGAGMILANNAASGDELLADPHLLPASMVTYTDGLRLLAYINNSRSPLAKITPAYTKLGIKPAPKMAAFSSQGPNTLNPDILKPDVTAPGLNILAAWTGAESPTGLAIDARRVRYNIISGTSMSCPHTSGVAALLKAAHSKWSPAAIKSALVTTATQEDNQGNTIKNGSLQTATPFSYGGGQIDPNAAFAPGLIYNASSIDYTLFLCALGYNGTFLQVFTIEPFTCPTKVPSVADLNYPSVAISDLSVRRTIVRTVTNVGPAKRTYNLTVEEPEGVRVDFDTNQLVFRHKYQEKTFKITFTPRKATAGYSFGSFTWSDGEHHVRSPVAIQTIL